MILAAFILFLLPEPKFDMRPVDCWTNGPALTKAIASGIPSLQSVKQWRLEWDYLNAPGPIWFEVWSSTNLVDWSVFSTTIKTNPGTHSIPLQLTNTFRFFTVRAVNEFGVGPFSQ